MERDIPVLDHPEGRYLNRQADLLWDLTIKIQRIQRQDGLLYEQKVSGLRLICFGAYKCMRDHGRQDLADWILRMTQTSQPPNLQIIQRQKVADAA